MSDIIQWAGLTNLSPTITALNWPAQSYMYLERVPTAWLDDEKRRQGICLEKLNLATMFNDWERGRIFCETFELRWEKQDGSFQTVYVGSPITLPDFTPSIELDLDGKQAKEPRYYYLWGNRVPDKQLAAIGENKRDDSQVFIEFQVPRIVCYPVSEHAKRVKLKVCEYLDPDSGAMLYYRFQSLEEER